MTAKKQAKKEINPLELLKEKRDMLLQSIQQAQAVVEQNRGALGIVEQMLDELENPKEKD